MHLSMYFVNLFNLSIYPCSCSWGCFPICLVLVVSSSPVRGSGTLQSGIRAYRLQHGPKWAMKDAVTEAGFLSAQQRSAVDERKLPKICLSVWTIGSSEQLLGRTSDVVEELGRSIPDGGQLEGNCGKNFVIFPPTLLCRECFLLALPLHRKSVPLSVSMNW